VTQGPNDHTQAASWRKRQYYSAGASATDPTTRNHSDPQSVITAVLGTAATTGCFGTEKRNSILHDDEHYSYHHHQHHHLIRTSAPSAPSAHHQHHPTISTIGTNRPSPPSPTLRRTENWALGDLNPGSPTSRTDVSNIRVPYLSSMTLLRSKMAYVPNAEQKSCGC